MRTSTSDNFWRCAQGIKASVRDIRYIYGTTLLKGTRRGDNYTTASPGNMWPAPEDLVVTLISIDGWSYNRDFVPDKVLQQLKYKRRHTRISLPDFMNTRLFGHCVWSLCPTKLLFQVLWCWGPRCSEVSAFRELVSGGSSVSRSFFVETSPVSQTSSAQKKKKTFQGCSPEDWIVFTQASKSEQKALTIPPWCPNLLPHFQQFVALKQIERLLFPSFCPFYCMVIDCLCFQRNLQMWRFVIFLCLSKQNIRQETGLLNFAWNYSLVLRFFAGRASQGTELWSIWHYTNENAQWGVAFSS